MYSIYIEVTNKSKVVTPARDSVEVQPWELYPALQGYKRANPTLVLGRRRRIQEKQTDWDSLLKNSLG